MKKALAALLFVVFSQSAFALTKHVRLSRSEPAADSTVTTAPTAIKLWFTAPVQVGVTTVRVTDAGRRAIEVKKPTMAAAAGSPVVAELHDHLAAGRYTVAWRTMSRDGHVISGTFNFTLAAASTPTH